MESKKCSPAQYQYRTNLILTKPEGEILKTIMCSFDCQNPSQLLKKIVHKEIVVMSKEEFKALETIANGDDINAAVKVDKYRKMVHELIDIMKHYDEFK